MIEIISNKLTEIKTACEEMHVQSLYLFGSGARAKDFNKQSDLDFLFSFQSDTNGNLLPPYYDYFDFLFKLEKITGKKIDLVAEERIENKYFLREVEKDKIKIYEHDS